MYQDSELPHQSLPRFPNICHHHHLVILSRLEYMDQVLKLHYVCKGLAIIPEGGLIPLFICLCCQPLLIPLVSPSAQGHGGVAAIEGLALDKNVTPRAVRMGAVSFIQNHYHVLHMAVHKVNPEVFPDQCPSPEPIYWAYQHPRHVWEGYMVRLRLWYHNDGFPGGLLQYNPPPKCRMNKVHYL